MQTPQLHSGLVLPSFGMLALARSAVLGLSYEVRTMLGAGIREDSMGAFAPRRSEAKQNVEKRSAGYTVVFPGALLHEVWAGAREGDLCPAQAKKGGQETPASEAPGPLSALFG